MIKLVERHPLGYTKVNLLSMFGYRVRLHIWHRETVEDAHNHRWNFVSVSLLGRFADTRYMEVPAKFVAGFAEPGPERVSCYPDRGTGRRYQPVTQDVLPRVVQPVMVHLRRPLRPWRCRLGEIHSFRPEGRGPHVSLVLTGRPRAASSDVWRRRR
jgi:hypothetical protein